MKKISILIFLFAFTGSFAQGPLIFSHRTGPNDTIYFNKPGNLRIAGDSIPHRRSKLLYIRRSRDTTMVNRLTIGNANVVVYKIDRYNFWINKTGDTLQLKEAIEDSVFTYPGQPPIHRAPKKIRAI